MPYSVLLPIHLFKKPLLTKTVRKISILVSGREIFFWPSLAFWFSSISDKSSTCIVRKFIGFFVVEPTRSRKMMRIRSLESGTEKSDR
ncbi:hypothetical protein L3Y34_012285 [Caenorhabditis briggsae]|uniref:Uncharacterized protein n=1 Tax=Caenorhabditis briggsae TaxID=6238 RepID=A0AAE9CVL7_CAEBR|nr:hypothetical protein L3Y34_012285 [Caenorhabditis briggsae]